MSSQPEKASAEQKYLRMLETLEQLLGIDGFELFSILNQAALQLAEALYAEKVDIFLFESDSNSLVALGTSDTPMGRRQVALGLNRLPLVNRGRMVLVYQDGEQYITGRADLDPEELVGITNQEGLGIKSEIIAPLNVDGKRRGVLAATSSIPNFFSEQELQFLAAAARWISSMIHRAELTEQRAQDVAERAKRMAAEDLMTILAHDLRNYLTPLKARLDLLQRRARREERELDIRDLETALATLTRFNQLIADLLDVARLEQGIFSIAPQPINLVDLVQDLVPAFQTPQQPIQVHTSTHEIIIAADSDRLRQVIENLLANAVTHAPKQTPIAITITTMEQAAHAWGRVSIHNQGPAISDELRTHLFQPFVSGSTSRGLGLGLYLARRITEAHHGQLTVDSPQHGGVQFTLLLPLNPTL